MTSFVVNPNDYASASGKMDQLGSSTRSAVSALAGALGGSGGMAGSDEPGQKFSQQYDPGAQQALKAAADIISSAGSYALLLHATGTNHAGADSDSTIGGGDSSLPGAPSPSEFSAPSVPSSYGGPPKEPDGLVAKVWHFIEQKVGYLWPNGEQDKLRAAGGAWKSASSSIRSAGDQITAVLALINAQQAPEVSLAAQKHTELKEDFDTVVEGAQGLGDACEQYAQFIDEAHQELIATLVQAAIEWAAMEAAAAVAGFFSFGSATVLSQGAIFARLAMFINRCRSIIQKLISAVEKLVSMIRALLSGLGKIFARIGSKLGRGGKTVDDAAEAGEDLKGLLTQHAKAAVDKFDQGIIKLSPRQQRAVNKNPNMLNTHKGNVLDKEMKRTVSQDPALQDRVEVTGLFRRGPDFKVKDPEPGKPNWYDLTTSKQRQPHLDRYEPDFGKGDTIHWDEL